MTHPTSLLSLNRAANMQEIILAACRAHAPQFDRMDYEIKKYALAQMRAALTVGVADLVKAGRSILDHGGDQDYADFDTALEPFEELIPYHSTIEADISAEMELPYQCDACSTPGYGPNAVCRCTPPEEIKPHREAAEGRVQVTDEMISAAKSAYWHEVHNGGGYSDKCYEAALRAALDAVSATGEA